jgi:hypothetical protein
MIRRKKRIIRKKGSKNKGSVFVSLIRLGSMLLVFLILVFSVCTAGYVIFFRTVLAEETPSGRNSVILRAAQFRPHQTGCWRFQPGFPLSRQQVIRNESRLFSRSPGLMFERSLTGEHHGDFGVCFVTGLDGFEIA